MNSVSVHHNSTSRRCEYVIALDKGWTSFLLAGQLVFDPSDSRYALYQQKRSLDNIASTAHYKYLCMIAVTMLMELYSVLSHTLQTYLYLRYRRWGWGFPLRTYNGPRLPFCTGGGDVATLEGTYTNGPVSCNAERSAPAFEGAVRYDGASGSFNGC